MSNPSTPEPGTRVSHLPPERHSVTAVSYTVGASEAAGGSTDTSRIDPSLRLALREVARTGHLLIGSDYDGTLAPIVANPNAARPLPETVSVLRRLANLPATSVAVVSGRALRDLAAMSRLPIEIQLVGSHGAEFDLDAIDGMDADSLDRLTDITNTCVHVTQSVPGAHLEFKPSAVAVHVRNAEREAAKEILDSLHEIYDSNPDVFLTRGKEVLELSVVNADKGTAIEKLRELNQATAVLFIGDDVTDEHAFATLDPSRDLSIRVGTAETAAMFTVDGPHDALEVLAVLGEEREAWLAGANAVPIEDHALLGDGTDVALLTPDGSINWLCHPGPDAPAIMAGLLGDPEAGHFSVKPVKGARRLSQNYVDNTMTVVTRWSGVTVTDYLDTSARHLVGFENQLRLVRVITGTTPVKVSFAPRPHFGSVPVSLLPDERGITVAGTADALVLVAPNLDWKITNVGIHPTATAIVDPSDGPVVLELRAGTDSMDPDPLDEPTRRRLTEQKWVGFVRELELPEHWPRMVKRSALTLKALCHEPTGAALAAATTSLPEWVGGIRNWDYRYCWLRDASMTVGALSLLGSTQEADAFMAWLEEVLELAAGPDFVHPLYTLDGSILGPEAVVDTLPGYAGSRPVRIGNAAQGQVQLDVFGPICEMVADAARNRGRVEGRDTLIVSACVEAVSRRWFEPDHGIWEIRDAPRDHVHSRVMCWVAVDRALQVMDLAGIEKPEWVMLRDEIKNDVMTNGWNAQLNSFVSAYGRHDVDAAVLSIVTSGMLPGDDPRAIGTINAIEAALRDGPTVYRYRHDDGLPGTEGGMHICTSWLIEAYAVAGMLDEARELMEQMVACAGTTGLLPEMHNPGSERGLGNHPQAYSHIGIVRCALALDNAEAFWNRHRQYAL